MPNVLINPNSGLIEFSTGIAGGNLFNPDFLSGARTARISFDNFGAVNLTSYVNITGSGIISGQDRFTVDGVNGRLFSVTDNLSGSLMSVNDIAGLPIFEVFDSNTIVGGQFNKNDFIITGNSVGIGGIPNTGVHKLYVTGNLGVSGRIFNDIIADQFPASTGIRRYFPEGTLATTIVQPLSGRISYFPFLIKKDVFNPKICVDVSTSTSVTNVPIRVGIYSGNNGFEGARLFWSGSITTIDSIPGVYRTPTNITLNKGPYYIASCNTGVPQLNSSFFRALNSNGQRLIFGEPTGNLAFFNNTTLLTHVMTESGSDLKSIIGSGDFGNTATVYGGGPLIALEY